MTHPDSGEFAPVCEDCGKRFALAAEEAAVRRNRGLPPSSRCPDCRARRLADRNARLLAAYATAPLGPPAPPSAAPGSGAGRLRPAVCEGCGCDTRVPFRPRDDRPVYCRACFDARLGR